MAKPLSDIEKFRELRPEYNKYGDTELVFAVAKDLNIDPMEVAQKLNYRDPAKGLGDFTRNLVKSGKQLQGMYYGLKAGYNQLTGDTNQRDKDVENYQRAMSSSNDYNAATDDFTNINSVGSAIDWAQGGLGYLAPMVLPSLVSGGFGAIAGRQLGGIAARKAGEVAAREVTAELAKKGLVSNAAKEFGTATAADAAGKLAISQAGKRGAQVGLFGSSFGQEFGSIYGELAADGRADEIGRAAAFTLPAAALDVVPELSLLGKLGKGSKEVSGNIFKRMAKEGGKQSLLESGTEIGQTALERAAAYKDLTSAEAQKEYINAGALGALGGKAAGSVTGALNRGESFDLLTAKKQVVDSSVTQALAYDAALLAKAMKVAQQQQKSAANQAAATTPATTTAATPPAAAPVSPTGGTPPVTPPTVNTQNVGATTTQPQNTVPSSVPVNNTSGTAPTQTTQQVGTVNPNLDINVTMNNGVVTRIDTPGGSTVVGKAAQDLYNKLANESPLFNTVADLMARNDAKPDSPYKVSVPQVQSLLRKLAESGVDENTSQEDTLAVIKSLRDRFDGKKLPTQRALFDSFSKLYDGYVATYFPDQVAATQTDAVGAAITEQQAAAVPQQPVENSALPPTDAPITNEAAVTAGESAPLGNTAPVVPVEAAPAAPAAPVEQQSEAAPAENIGNTANTAPTLEDIVNTPLSDSDIVGLAMMAATGNINSATNVRDYKILTAKLAGYSSEDIKKAFNIKNDVYTNATSPKRVATRFKKIMESDEGKQKFHNDVRKVFPEWKDAFAAAADFVDRFRPSKQMLVQTDQTQETAKEVLGNRVDEDGNETQNGYRVVNSANSEQFVNEGVDRDSKKQMQRLEEIDRLEKSIPANEKRIAELNKPEDAQMRERLIKENEQDKTDLAALKQETQKKAEAQKKKLKENGSLANDKGAPSLAEQERRDKKKGKTTETNRQQVTKIVNDAVDEGKVAPPTLPATESTEETRAEAEKTLYKAVFSFLKRNQNDINTKNLSIEYFRKFLAEPWANLIDRALSGKITAADLPKFISAYAQAATTPLQYVAEMWASANPKAYQTALTDLNGEYKVRMNAKWVTAEEVSELSPEQFAELIDKFMDNNSKVYAYLHSQGGVDLRQFAREFESIAADYDPGHPSYEPLQDGEQNLPPEKLESRGEALPLKDAVAIFSGARSLVSDWIDLGIAKWIKTVDIQLEHLAEGVNGIIRFVGNNKPVVSIAYDVTIDPAMLRQTLGHEIWHNIDMAGHGNGVYSGQPEMAVTVRNGKLVGVGSVTKELIDAFNNKTLDPDLAAFLSYPLDSTKYPMSVERVQKELIAQLGHVVSTDSTLLDSLPVTAAYMNEVLTHVRNTEAVSNPSRGIAEARTQDFTNRGQQTTGSDGSREATDGTGRSQESPTSTEGQGEVVLASMGSALRGTKTVSVASEMWGAATRKAANLLLGTNDLMDVAERVLPSVAKFREVLQAKQAARAEKVQTVANIGAEFTKLPRKIQQRVNKLIMDSTMSGQWAYKINANSTVVLDPDLAKEFNSLPAEAQDVIRKVFAHGYNVRKEMRMALTDAATDARDKAIVAANGDKALIDQANNKFKENLDAIKDALGFDMKRPYAPLARYGDHVVVAKSQDYLDAVANNDTKQIRKLQKDPDHYSVSFHKSVYSRAKAKWELGRDPKYAQVDGFAKDAVAGDAFSGAAMGQAFENLRTMIRGDVADPKMSQQLDQMALSLYLQTIAELSARQSNNRRVGVAGAETDMMKSFMERGVATAGLFANLRHNAEINDALSAVKKEADNGTLGERAERRDYYNELALRHMVKIDEPSSLTQGLLRFSSYQSLVTNPAYYLNNLTQVPVLTVPFLAGKYGYGEAWTAVISAYRETAKLVGDSGLTGAIRTTNANARYKAAVDQMIKEGWLDADNVQDTGKLNVSDNGMTTAAFKTIDAKLMGIQQRVEAVNRFATALAAYDLAIKDGKSFDEAMKEARVAVDRTQFDYSDINAPRMFRGDVGKILLQFKKYSLFSGAFVVRTFNDMFKASTPQERAVAAKQFAFTMAHTVAVAGSIGLPVPMFVIGAIQALLRTDDEPEDLEMKFRKYVNNPEIATLITRGVPAFLGMDMSGSVGLGSALNPFRNIEFDFSSRAATSKSIVAALGPTVGQVERVLEATGMVGDDPVGAVSMLVPNGIRNFSKAIGMSGEGLTNKRGDVLIKPEDISDMAVFMTAIGMKPTQLEIRKLKEQSLRTVEAYYKDRANGLMKKYVESLEANEPVQPVVDELADLNDSIIKMGLQPVTYGRLRSYVRGQPEREAMNLDGVQYNKRNYRYVESLQ